MLELNSRELLLKRLDMLSSEIERLKRDVIHVLVTEAPAAKQKPCHFAPLRVYELAGLRVGYPSKRSTF